MISKECTYAFLMSLFYWRQLLFCGFFSWMTPQKRSSGYLFWPVWGINLRQKELSVKAFRQLKKDRYVSYARPNKLRCVVCSYCAIQIRTWLLRLYFPCIFTYSNQRWFFFARVNQYFLFLSGKIFTFGTLYWKSDSL